MATEVGSAFVTIMPSAKGFGSALGKTVDGESGRVGQRGGRTFGSAFARTSVGPIRAGFGTIGKLGAGIFAGLGAVNVFKGFIEGARESAKVTAITSSVIKSTGGAANLTAKQVGSLATAISNKTGIDDEQIQANENVLLTFTKVRNEVGRGNQVFSRATGLAQDMATVLGTDASGATLQLGKALNDPIKGITALSRAGVSFTQKQKDKIKSLVDEGKTLQAQKIILREVGKEFGGAAAAAATPMDKLKVTLGNVGETIGATLIPWIDRGAVAVGQFMSGLTGSGDPNAMATKFSNFGVKVREFAGIFRDEVVPRVKEFGAFLQDQVVPKLQQLGVFLTGSVVPALARMATFVKQNLDFFLPFAAALGTIIAGWKIYVAVTRIAAAVQAVFNVVLAANPIGLVIIAIAALVAGLVVAYRRSETFRNIVQAALRGVVAAFNALKGAAEAVVGAVIGSWNAVSAGTRRVWSAITGFVRAVPGTIIGFFTRWTLVGVVVSHFDQIRSGVSRSVGALLGFVSGIPGRILAGLGALGGLLFSAGQNIIQGLIDGITSRIGAVTAKIASVAKTIRDHFPFSPAKAGPLRVHPLDQAGANMMEQLADGLRKGGKKAVEAIQEVVGRVSDKLSSLRDAAASVRSSVADSVQGIVDISKVGASVATGAQDAEGNDITRTPSISETFQGFAAQAKAFATALAEMARRKVAPAIIAAVAAAGPAQGLTAAQAFASASKPEIVAANASMGQIEAAAKAAGTSVLNTTRIPADIKREAEMLSQLQEINAALRTDVIASVVLKGDDLLVAVKRAEKKNARR